MSWPIVKLGEVCEVRLGRTPARANKAYWEDGEKRYPWVAIKDMGQSFVLSQTMECITQKALDECFGGVLVPKGTLLLSFKLSIGKVAILGIEAIHNEAIASIRPVVPNIQTAFLAYVLPQLVAKIKATEAVKGKTLNRKQICELPLPLPPLFEQEQIVEELERKLSRLERVEQVAREAVAVCAQARRAVLAEAFRHE